MSYAGAAYAAVPYAGGTAAAGSGGASNTLDVTFPAFTALFADASMTFETNQENGRVRAGFGLVATDVVVVLPVDLATRVEKAIAYPTPTLVDGRPT